MTQPDDELLTVDEQVASTRDIEVSEADAVEQALTVDPADTGYQARPDVPSRAFEANEYDAIEQDRVVEFDHDYR